MTFLTFCCATVLALVHVFAGKLRFLDAIPRSRWLSLAGGVSVAYVFLHLVPEFSASEVAERNRSGGGITGWLAQRTHFVALVGLTFFYALEHLARTSRRSQRAQGEKDCPGMAVFWLHISSFAVYVAITGYLLHEKKAGPVDLILFTLALALHFVVNDYGLRHHHKDAYRRYGRWALAAASYGGWAIGYTTRVSELPLTLLVAFLAGGIVLNVLKEELPEEREGRLVPFVAGVVFYAALLLALE